jgi:hypothetical protein
MSWLKPRPTKILSITTDNDSASHDPQKFGQLRPVRFSRPQPNLVATLARAIKILASRANLKAEGAGQEMGTKKGLRARRLESQLQEIGVAERDEANIPRLVLLLEPSNLVKQLPSAFRQRAFAGHHLNGQRGTFQRLGAQANAAAGAADVTGAGKF